MSKMSELSLTLDEMITCGEEMIKAAKTLAECAGKMAAAAKAVREIFSGSNEQEKPAETAKPAKTYTFTDVRKAFSAKSHAGYTAEVKALINKYGADKLSAVKEEDYPAIMEDLEVIG